MSFIPNKPIPYGRQNITQDDIQAVLDVIQSDYLTQGPSVLNFEKEFAEYIGCKYAVAVANGTAALHLSAIALGVQEGTKVITTPITFAASANCIKYCGGTVEFADIDIATGLLDIKEVRKLLESKPKGYYSGIIPVDFAGYPVNLEAFRDLADEFSLWILEDACHAPGGYFTDSRGVKQYCGNGTYAELAIFSFHPVKHIATGEGGMITTNSKELYDKLLSLRTHGITRDTAKFKGYPSVSGSGEINQELMGGWYMEMQDLGYNYRISDILTALGSSQLRRADAGISRRRAIADKYDEAFMNHQSISVLNPQSNQKQINSGIGHAFHLYIIKVGNRKRLYDYLKEHQIFAQVHYLPVHMMPYYRNLGWYLGQFPLAEEYYEQCLSLPMYPALTVEEQDYVIEKLLTFFNE